jgi:hypothetical protein
MTRIGITNDPAAQKADLEGVYQSLTHWRIEAGPLTQAAALQRKRYLVAWRGCANQRHNGRDDADTSGANWYVYSFKHDVHK